MPSVPHGTVGVIAVLKIILAGVRDGCPPEQRIRFEGSETEFTLDQLCVDIRKSRLIIKKPSGWVLSSEANRFLESGDELYLTAYFCARIKFVTEILFLLSQKPRKTVEINDIAVREYQLPWKTKASVVDRLLWLKEAGLTGYSRSSKFHSITQSGREFLKNLAVTDPAEIGSGSDETAHETEPHASDWVLLYCANEQDNLPFRKITIGHMGEDICGFAEKAAEYLTGIRSGSDEKLPIRTLDQLGFIKKKGHLITPTGIAKLWLEEKNIVDLVCCLHAKYLFVFEMLREMDGRNRTRRELSAIAKASYGFDKTSFYHIYRRIRIFTAAGLIRNTIRSGHNERLKRYTLTNRGRRLLKLVPLQMPKSEPVAEPESVETALFEGQIEVQRTALMLQAVMKCLLTKKKNGRPGGSFTASEVFWSVRSTYKFGDMSRVKNVAQTLEFLASPVMNCAEKTEVGYRAKMSLSDVSAKLAFYSKICKK